MLFNSYEFIFVFLPITFFIYFMLNHKGFTRASIVWLMCASLSFYGYWDIMYLPLLLISIGFNYCLSGFIIKARRKNIESFALKHTKKNLQNLSLDSYMLRNTNQSKESNTYNACHTKVLKNETKHKNIESYDSTKTKLLLFIALTFNIVLLGYFKYMNFFLETIDYIFNKDIPTLHIILPLGISFFTITQIAYLVDCYEGEVEERSFINYALFVTFFPHLIAGPILHHAEMMPQFANKNNKVLNHKNITRGIFIFSIGLFKKVVIADSFSIWANAGFGVVDSGRFLNIFESWATSLSYTFQLYFDFSGYCDMAIGLGLLFNIMLPINFYSPYKSLNITEFWRKWHITLGRFLKSYIYIPLGGNRNDKHNRDTNKDCIDKRRINKYIYIYIYIYIY